jgi:tetratricopeptide (TPR) repeat protein
VDSSAAWKPLAQLLADLGRFQEASLSFQHVLKLDPTDAEAAFQAGVLLFRSGKMEEALALLSISKGLGRGHALMLRLRAMALQNLARPDEAAADMAGAHALDPANADICNSMGVLLRKLGRREGALAWFDNSITLRPDFTLAHNNRAFSLSRLHRFDEALAVYAALKAKNLSDAEPDWNAGLLHLLRQPMWLGGEPIAGKTILI